MIFQNAVLNLYKSRMFKRYDDNGVAFYFSEKDFEGLNKTPFTFFNQNGNKLQGYFYNYDNPIPNRLAVFDHGMGGGHRAYMREIELIAREGYTVFSYDHTGCMESEGESTNGFATSLADLDFAINALKKDSRFANSKIAVIGHSWGGYSTANIAAFQPDVSHIIAISCPISVKAMVYQSFGGILKYYRKAVLDLESKSNPKYVNSDAVAALSKSNANILIIHSDDDKVVSKEWHFDVLKAVLSGRDNIKFMLVDGKLHNPNYTVDAVKYLNEYISVLAEKTKKKLLLTQEQKKEFLDSFDWKRMTEQDTEIWKEIFETLKK